EIAEAYGAKVTDFPWCDDFSAARNESLRHATGAWIIWVDADEVLPEEESGKIREAMEEPFDRGFTFILKVIDPVTGALRVSYRQLRMFPNHPEVRFEWPVHEQVAPSLRRRGIRIIDTDIVLLHLKEERGKEEQEKAERYIEVMEGWLSDHQDDQGMRFRLAQAYAGQGRDDEAKRELQRIADDSRCREGGPALYRSTLIAYAQACMRGKNHRQAVEALETAQKLDTDHILIHLLLGECYLALEDTARAVAFLERGLTYGHGDDSWPMNLDAIRRSGWGLLGQAYERLGDWQRAMGAYQAAINEQRD
ncbi:MAG: tetratricopeptide repeat protein, partial [Candidatus Latescibacteria bacterium]|nr:tetratricopeptide repeat protein [Candidatus Latescibacterota bacterium]